MKKTLTVFMLMGYLYFGKYIDAEYYDLEYRAVKYRAGIHLEFKPDDNSTLFIDSETLMRDNSESGFYPSQHNYSLGVSYRLQDVEVILARKCMHPVDGRSGGAAAQDYTLIETRYNF